MSLLLFLSLDSLVASFALGLLGSPSQYKRQICLLFGLCDGLATLIGTNLGFAPVLTTGSSHPWIVPAVTCIWILIVASVIVPLLGRKPNSIFVVSLVPFMLAIDNLLAGGIPSGSSLPLAMAPMAATLLSTAFAWAGYGMAALLERRIWRALAVGLGVSGLLLPPILF
jgi:hypothetical protein